MALIAAVAIAASAASHTEVTPPVIHEPFTALPCPLHPDTAIDVIGCQEHRILRSDRAIDQEAARIFRLLRTESARLSFVTGERSWLQYRGRSCAAEASHLAGGSAHAVALLSCTLGRNKSHLGDLIAMRKALA